MKTYSIKPSDVTRKWYVVDASEAPLGRVATQVATLLTGKGKPQYSHHIDCGDYVVVINADNLKVTCDNLEQNMYYHHSHFPGGLKETQLKKQIEKDSTQAVIHAIRGMLPVNKLRDGRLLRLMVYTGAEHNHAAQKPETISLKKGDK
jgi:large subunit ribosomal protein L13